MSLRKSFERVKMVEKEMKIPTTKSNRSRVDERSRLRLSECPCGDRWSSVATEIMRFGLFNRSKKQSSITLLLVIKGCCRLLRPLPYLAEQPRPHLISVHHAIGAPSKSPFTLSVSK